MKAHRPVKRFPRAPPLEQAQQVAPLVAHVVVLSELSPRAKAQYTRFLIENNVQFARRPSDGRYVANIRLEKPPSAVISTESTTSSSDALRPPTSTTTMRAPLQQPPTHREKSSPDCSRSEQSSDEEDEDEEENEEDEEEQAQEVVATIPVHLERYANLIRQFGLKIQHRKTTGTYTIESKLVRLINEIYDARAEETASPSCGFAAFVRVYLTNRFGLPSLVEQQAWELIKGLYTHQKRPDVEMISCFLDGSLDEQTLLCFLTARDQVQRELAVATALFRPTTAAHTRRRSSSNSTSNPSMTPQRRRRGSALACSIGPVWLSKNQVDAVAHRVFGANEDDGYLQFVHNVRSFLTTGAISRSMQELLEVQEFYGLVVDTFVSAQRERHQSVDTEGRSLRLSFGSESRHAHDGQPSSSLSSPSPLPPPPLPRAFGRTSAAAGAHPRTAPDVEMGPSRTRLYDASAATVRPVPTTASSSSTAHKAETALSSTGPSGHGDSKGSDDVQKRLSSLLARMQQRQSGGAS